MIATLHNMTARSVAEVDKLLWDDRYPQHASRFQLTWRRTPEGIVSLPQLIIAEIRYNPQMWAGYFMRSRTVLHGRPLIHPGVMRYIDIVPNDAPDQTLAALLSKFADKLPPYVRDEDKPDILRRAWFIPAS
jgi:hypothetical protein